MEKKLTIGMAHYSDYNGVYFTIQDIVKELVFNGRRDLLAQIEFLVVENNSACEHAAAVKRFANGSSGLVRVVDLDDRQGTSCSRNKVIEEARTNFVLVMDCHVLLCPTIKTLEQLLTFISYNDKSEDLFTGPLVYDSMNNISTHFDDEWGGGMWGRWGSAWKCVCDSSYFSVMNVDKRSSFASLGTQERIKECEYCSREFPDIEFAGHDTKLKQQGYQRCGFDPKEKPFEIFAQGLGLFLTRKNSWLKFNSDTSGFGGEECYIHEKYRKAGKKCICLPFLKWLHRFDRPDGIDYNLTTEAKLNNYILEFKEIGLDLSKLKEHFVDELNVSEEIWQQLLKDAGAISDESDEGEGDLESKIKLLEKQIASLRQDESKDGCDSPKCCKKKKSK